MTRRGFVGKLLAGLAVLKLLKSQPPQPCYLFFDGEKIIEGWEEAGEIPEGVLWNMRQGYYPVAIRGPIVWTCGRMRMPEGVLDYRAACQTREAAERWLLESYVPPMNIGPIGLEQKITHIDYEKKIITIA